MCLFVGVPATNFFFAVVVIVVVGGGGRKKTHTTQSRWSRAHSLHSHHPSTQSHHTHHALRDNLSYAWLLVLLPTSESWLATRFDRKSA